MKPEHTLAPYRHRNVLTVTGLATVALLVSGGCALSSEDDTAVPAQPGLGATERPAGSTRAARQAVVDDHIVRWHERAGHRVVRTVTQENGDVVDLVAAETVPGSQVTPPPTYEFALGPGEEQAVEPTREGAGDPALVRFVRPRFLRYVEGIDDVDTFDEYLRLVDQSRGTPPVGLAPGTPCTSGCARLYASSTQSISNRGVDSYVNAKWAPGEIGESPNSFFLAQSNVIDPNTSLTTNAEWIGWIIGRYPLMGDNLARLMSEFFTAGTNNTGNYTGGWAGAAGVLGFVPVAGASVALGDEVVGISSVGGSQYSHRMLIEYFPAATQPCGTGCSGSWWLLYDTVWVGYYPVGSGGSPNINFDRITSSAPRVQWYGEVWDSTPATWTSTDMASPVYASASFNWQQAAYFRVMSRKNASNNTWTWSTSAEVADGGGDDPNCYTRWETYVSDPGFRTMMYFGGPGRTALNACDPF